MPVIKQAAKKLRHDIRRTKQNVNVQKQLHDLIKSMRKAPSKKTLTGVFRTLDKAAKRHLVHPNKAARLKSRLSKLLKK